MLAVLALLVGALCAPSDARPVVRPIFADRLSMREVSTLGVTVEFGSAAYYFVPGNASAVAYLASGTTAPSSWTASLFPLTVVASHATTLTSDALTKAMTNFTKDDVWTSDFMDTTIARYEGDGKGTFDSSLTSYANVTVLASAGYSSGPLALNFDAGLPSGPYFATFVGGKLSVHQAWKLYADVQQAFFYGTLQSADGSFTTLTASVPDTNGVPAIGVPSRLYYKPPSADKPLSGVRVTFKDLYDMKGLKTSMANRAWESLYPPATANSAPVQRVIDAGGIIVGKTRLSQFANGAYGTADDVDYHTPFNIRGDGYQDASSSSSGAGAATGSYGWLDMNVGSDTGGSVRAPAGVNGVFGNRPSQGAISLEGVLELSAPMDTSAFLAHNAYDFAAYGKAYYGANETLASKKLGKIEKLLYPLDPPKGAYNNTPSPGFFPPSNNATVPIYESFVSKLEGYLKLNRTQYAFYDRVNASLGDIPPAVVGPVWSFLTAYDQWENVGKKFFADYAAAHDGDTPFVNPPVAFDWEYGRNGTQAERDSFFQAKLRFQNFINTDFLPNCTTLSVFPLTQGTVSDKSLYHDAPSSVYNGTNRYSISQLGGVPEVVLPIGQVPYASTITNTTKYLPVSVSLQSGFGCDFVLFDLVAALADAGIVATSVQTGTSKTFAQ